MFSIRNDSMLLTTKLLQQTYWTKHCVFVCEYRRNVLGIIVDIFVFFSTTCL